MKTTRMFLVVAVLAMMALSWSSAYAGGVRIGIGIGIPIGGPVYAPYPYYPPYAYYPPYPYYYPPYRVYAAPAPVYVVPQPSTVYAQPAPTAPEPTRLPQPRRQYQHQPMRHHLSNRRRKRSSHRHRDLVCHPRSRPPLQVRRTTNRCPQSLFRIRAHRPCCPRRRPPRLRVLILCEAIDCPRLG